MKVLDLFSGIGGFSLGLERAGMKTIAFCEIEPFCRKILKKHWPDTPIFKDIKELTVNDLPTKPDLICGGYPCQPFSVAGKQRGTEDNRHLWPEMFRLIKECKPHWVICENVAGHIKLGLDQMLSDLEAEGYTWEAFVIPACAINAPHRRDRVWIVAHSEYNGPGNHETMANASASRMQARLPEQEQWEEGNPKKSNHGSDRPCWRQITDHWATEPDMDRVAHGIPNRVDRIKALGNSVVPQIPEIIGRFILETRK